MYAAYINIERFLVEIFLAYAMFSNVCVEQLDFGECREGGGGGGGSSVIRRLSQI